MPKNNGEKKLSKSESDVCCHHHCKGKFKWAFCIAILVVICAIAEHIYNNYHCIKLSENNRIKTQHVIEENQKSYALRIAELYNELTVLKDEIALLKSAIPNQNNMLNKCNTVSSKHIIRQKWKIWNELQTKMISNDKFDRELKIFFEEFAYDEELITLVKNFTKSIICDTSDTNEHNGNIIDIYKRYIKKIVQVRKIDHKKLLEISGYVLSSIQEQDGK